MAAPAPGATLFRRFFNAPNYKGSALAVNRLILNQFCWSEKQASCSSKAFKNLIPRQRANNHLRKSRPQIGKIYKSTHYCKRGGHGRQGPGRHQTLTVLLIKFKSGLNSPDSDAFFTLSGHTCGLQFHFAAYRKCGQENPRPRRQSHHCPFPDRWKRRAAG